MRLFSVELRGYRRFEVRSCLDVGGDVIALVGPNEAGKSSILQAMLTLNEEGKILARDRTRGYEYSGTVKAHFVLDDEDRKDLAEIEGAEQIRWWTFERTEQREPRVSLHPEPKRNLQFRQDWAVAIQSYASDLKSEEVKDVVGEDISPYLTSALTALRSEDQELTSDELAAVRAFGRFYETINQNLPDENSTLEPELRKLLITLSEDLEFLRRYNEGAHPKELAQQLLLQNRPTFVMFGTEDRALQSTYTLEEIEGEVPRALDNLAALAELDLDRLLRAVRTTDYGLQETLIRQANTRLAKAFKSSWQQSDVSVQFALRENLLVILVTLPGSENAVSQLEDRSDGLRSFVALRAFIAGLGLEKQPIVLIDEAETHLHYDAQADMVDVFSTQTEAAKIIYTTHSAGCLPRDLGTGVRVVVPNRDRERSVIRNSVWQRSDAGFTPIAFAMGATVFAFLPARQVVLVEGPTDAMLLPTLFREASDKDSLAFQIAPGLASATQADYVELAGQGGKVRYLADGDNDGVKYLKLLYEFDVPVTHLFCLAEGVAEGVTLEDLLDARHYASAVNHLLQTFANPAVEWPLSSVPDVGRSKALEQWCKDAGMLPPDKRKVAQQLLDMKSEAERRGDHFCILSATRRGKLKNLLSRIEESFVPVASQRTRRVRGDILKLLRDGESSAPEQESISGSTST